MLTGLLCALLALRITHVAALDLTNSNWITFGARDVPGGVIHDFRLDLTSPAGKNAVSSEIIIACDDLCDIWVNGASYLGEQTNWQTSNSFCVQASASSNVFAVQVENEGSIPNASAFIAAIQIHYSDGSSDTFVTDTTWRASSNTSGLQQVGFDDSNRAYENTVGAVDTPPWNLPTPAEGPSSVSFSDAHWIWTAEIPGGGPDTNTPVGFTRISAFLFVQLLHLAPLPLPPTISTWSTSKAKRSGLPVAGGRLGAGSSHWTLLPP